VVEQTVVLVVQVAAQLTRFRGMVLAELEHQDRVTLVVAQITLKTRQAVAAVLLQLVVAVLVESVELQVMEHNGTQLLHLHIMAVAVLVFLVAQLVHRAVRLLVQMVLQIPVQVVVQKMVAQLATAVQELL
jgi:hypothetical protein